MSGDLFCSLVTPQKCIHSSPVWQVTLQGASGRFSIRRDHAPIVASIASGELEIAVTENDRKRFQVGEGIVCCKNNRCSIICPSAVRAPAMPAD